MYLSMDHISENQVLPQNKNITMIKGKDAPLTLIKLIILLKAETVRKQLVNIALDVNFSLYRKLATPYLLLLYTFSYKTISLTSNMFNLIGMNYSYLFTIIRNSHWGLRPFKLPFSGDSSAKQMLHERVNLNYSFKKRYSYKAIKKTKARRLLHNFKKSRRRTANRKLNHIQPTKYNTLVWFNRLKKYSWKKRRVLKRSSYPKNGQYVRILYNKNKRDRLFRDSLNPSKKFYIKRTRTKAYPLERKLLRNNLSFLNVLGFYSMSEPVGNIKESKVYHPWYKKSKNYRTSLFLSRHVVDFSRSILRNQLINKSIINNKSIRNLSYKPNLNTVAKRVAMRYLHGRKTRMLLKLKQVPRLAKLAFLSKVKKVLYRGLYNGYKSSTVKKNNISGSSMVKNNVGNINKNKRNINNVPVKNIPVRPVISKLKKKKSIRL